jgi:hypothetical protein
MPSFSGIKVTSIFSSTAAPVRPPPIVLLCAGAGAEDRPPPGSRLGPLPPIPPNGAAAFGDGSLNPPDDGGLPSKNPHALAVSATEPAPDGGALVVNVDVVRRGTVACGLDP